MNKLNGNDIGTEEISICAFHDTFRPSYSCIGNPVETDICGKTFKYETGFLGFGGKVQGHSCKGRKIDMCNCPIWNNKEVV